MEPGVAETAYLRLQVVDDELDAVPASGHRLAAVGHGPCAGAGLPAQQQAQVPTGDGGEGRSRVGIDREAEMRPVKGDGVDHVADVDGGHLILPPWRYINDN